MKYIVSTRTTYRAEQIDEELFDSYTDAKAAFEDKVSYAKKDRSSDKVEILFGRCLDSEIVSDDDGEYAEGIHEILDRWCSKTIYITQFRESGIEIDRFKTREEAEAAIDEYEADDLEEENYESNTYEIYEEDAE